ncbi:cytochrome P450 52A12 [Ophiobolus disseminans]|uniref:Cytochrome P450 52A12 n=1 Tax=Ophiobolus disseminans TaxID=1469910 RepID=A0A6A7A3S2_9PLEO|nr:cytochrome P450 52A12 [Ophiobolus disseminans]
MQSLIFMSSWVAISFVVYKIVNSVFTSRRHARAARELDCKLPDTLQCRDPIGIENVLNLLKADKECRFPQFVKGRADTHRAREGRPVTTFRRKILGSMNFHTVDPENVRAILATQFKDFGLGESRNSNFFPLLGNGIFSTDGEEWQHSRALLRPQFARDQISDLEYEERHVGNLMWVIPAAEDSWTGAFDIMPLFFRLTLDSATGFLFGQSVDVQLAALLGHTSSHQPLPVSEADFAFSFDKAKEIIAKGSRLGDKYWLVHGKELKEHCRRCHVFIDHYVQRALNQEKLSTVKTASGKEKYTFLDALAETTQDPIQLRSQLLSILLAGRDTTASLLSYVFMVLTQHPRVYAKLRTTITEEFGTYKQPKNLTFASLKSCTYLQWALNETLRLYPIVPINVRHALRDTTLPRGGGPDGKSPIYIRKGQSIDYSYYTIHRRKDLWGDDADDFKPERWKGRKSSWDYLPFNGGPRICIGQQFALTQAGYVVVRMLQKYDAIEGVGNSWEEKEMGGVGYVRHRCALTSCPADGVRVRMREAED